MTRFPGLKSYRIAKLWKLSRVVSNLLVGPFAYSLRPFFLMLEITGEPSCQGIKKSQECHTRRHWQCTNRFWSALFILGVIPQKLFFCYRRNWTRKEQQSASNRHLLSKSFSAEFLSGKMQRRLFENDQKCLIQVTLYHLRLLGLFFVQGESIINCRSISRQDEKRQRNAMIGKRISCPIFLASPDTSSF